MTHSLKAEFIDDNTLELEWDVNDPECAFLNDMTDEEREKFVVDALESMIKEYDPTYEAQVK